MTTTKPLILIGNDDGIHAKGIHYLVDFLAQYADIIVAAPETHQSGKSSAITCDRPLRVKRYPDYNGAQMYSIDGTPVDAIKLALEHLVPRRPNFVVSGINHGLNHGNSALYSGTMGVAFEGCVAKIPSVGFSYDDMSPECDMSHCRQIVCSIMEEVMRNGLEEGVCLNVNIPSGCEIKGAKVVRPAKGHWSSEYIPHTEPDGTTIYTLGGSYVSDEPECADTDVAVMAEGFASITPNHPDQTRFDLLPLHAKRFEK